MKIQDSKYQLRPALERAYPLPENYLLAVQHQLQALKQMEEKPVKKPMTLLIVLAVLAIGLGSALALSQWGVLDFLFQDTQREDLVPYTHALDLRQGDGQVEVWVDSAFYDGQTFAMDWTIVNTQPQKPVFVHVDAFSIGGQKLRTDGNDSFDAQWLPGIFAAEGSMQDGERIDLPLELLKGDVQPVRMQIGVYSPNQPVFDLPQDEADLTEEQQDAQRKALSELALQKIKEGHLVTWGDTFAIVDPTAEYGIAFVLGDIKSILPQSAYTRSQIELAFDLDITAARSGVHSLSPDPSYAFELFTTHYTKALRTPSGLSLHLLGQPRKGQEEAFLALMDQGSWQLTDEQGEPVDPRPDHFLVTGWDFPDGSFGRRVELSISLKAEELPEAVSLSFVPGDGSPAFHSPLMTK